MPTLPLTKELLLETLRAILLEERDAIRRLDADGMDRASDAKEAVLARLHETPHEDRGPLIEALAELQPELRHNMILFTHAAAFIAAEKRDRAKTPSLRKAS
ncbi:MAG: hypothetical protein KIT84_41990 [Labilithrix sp.]|nr:hypothetical protein [Labilithrix sp.]MCW5817646.1 hypothetical protein [Labilithrix sp.]